MPAENASKKYVQLMNEIKNGIVEGRYSAGEMLPSENVFAARYQVSRHTVRKALSILEGEGFVYAQHGRGTFVAQQFGHTCTSHNIAVITTYLSDYIFPRVIQGIDNVLSAEGYSIILKNTGNSRAREAKVLEELLQKDIDGLIIEPSKSQIFCKHTRLYQQMDYYKIPYVFIQGCFPQMMDKPHVIMDDCRGGYLVTKYLTDLGHRRIVGVFKADDTQGRDRHKGYVQAIQEAGILYDPDLIVWFHTEDRREKPYKEILQLVKGNRGFDAIVCYNDQTAVGVIQALEQAGIRVPGDVSVTGYDNSSLARTAPVSLTTINHPQEQLGRLAAELLLRMMRGQVAVEERTILIQPELIEGDSCARRGIF